MFKRLIAVFLILFALPVLAGRQIVLSDPPPIDVPAGMTSDQVMNAIIAGMDKRHWTVESSKAGELVAVQAPRDVMVKVKIVYDTKSVSINYLDSSNFLYEEHNGVREIHEKYAVWMSNLTNDIKSALSVATALNHP
jgi:hypothetical protein